MPASCIRRRLDVAAEVQFLQIERFVDDGPRPVSSTITEQRLAADPVSPDAHGSDLFRGEFAHAHSLSGSSP